MIIMGVVTLYHSLIIAKDATKYNTFFEYQAMIFEARIEAGSANMHRIEAGGWSFDRHVACVL